MAQQTKCGHVYVISNVGSFGENVYKIGLTRRLEPIERVRELGDASVPFAFDIHALIYCEDAPALEATLHRRFLQNQVNKVNRRKEFFRARLQDIRGVVEEMKHEVKWTLTAEARDYRETLAMEKQMQDDPEYRNRWTAEQAAYQPYPLFDEEEGEALHDDEDVADGEKAQFPAEIGSAIV
jgi:Meiotically up-regulated gene 113